MSIPVAPRILTVAALCAAALIGLVVSEGMARDSGQEVLLPMEAVDPRALLSGHYVQLNLTQRLEANEVCPPNAPEDDWLALRPEGDAYVLAGAADSEDDAHAIAPLIVKGTFTCLAPTTTDNPEVPGLPGSITLDIGVDRFHINQADALRVEGVLRDQRANELTRAFAIVSVGRDGRARLKGLLIDDERLELAWL